MFTVCLLLCCLSFLQFSLPQFLSWCSQRCVLWLLHSCSSLRIQEGSFPLWRCISTDAGTLCAVLSPLWRRVSTDAGTLCAVLSPLWRRVSTDAGTLCAVLSPLWRQHWRWDAVGCSLPTLTSRQHWRWDAVRCSLPTLTSHQHWRWDAVRCSLPTLTLHQHWRWDAVRCSLPTLTSHQHWRWDAVRCSSCLHSLPWITASGLLPQPSFVFWDFNKYLSWTCNWIHIVPDTNYIYAFSRRFIQSDSDHTFFFFSV